MNAFYTLVIAGLFVSCTITKPSSSLDYLGTSCAATDSVTVFVDVSSIEKRYTIIGNGYVKTGIYGNIPVRIIQKESIEKANLNGADVVLIQDVILPQTGLNTVMQLIA